jgi:nitroreductase
VDTHLAITSKRDERRYADRPVPSDVLERILDAGRLAGSAVNRQPWRFVVVENQELRQELAETLYAPGNVQGAATAIAVVALREAPLDIGRCVQNMMLAAWNDGVASCPNGMSDRDRARELLGLRGDERVQLVLSFGYPARPRDPESRSAEEWSSRANRKPLEEVVERR